MRTQKAFPLRIRHCSGQKDLPRLPHLSGELYPPLLVLEGRLTPRWWLSTHPSHSLNWCALHFSRTRMVLDAWRCIAPLLTARFSALKQKDQRNYLLGLLWASIETIHQGLPITPETQRRLIVGFKNQKRTALAILYHPRSCASQEVNTDLLVKYNGKEARDWCCYWCYSRGVITINLSFCEKSTF